MVKLSKSGWNNVIIFAVLAFILLINLMDKEANNTGEPVTQEQSLLGEHAVILTLSLNKELTIERIGRTWRAQPAKISGQALEQMMLSWQQLSGQPLIDAPLLDNKMALIVSIETAGSNEVTIVSIYATDDQLLLFNHQSELWLAVPILLYNQLFPDQIFAE